MMISFFQNTLAKAEHNKSGVLGVVILILIKYGILGLGGWFNHLTF